VSFESLERAIREQLEAEGYDVVLAKMATGRRVHVVIDREPPEKVKVNDLVAANRLLGALLEAEGYERRSFHVEVDSPGLDRLLTREKDFERFAGSEVKVRLREKRNGRRSFQGELAGWDAGCVLVNVDGEAWRMTLNELAEVRLVPQL